MSGEKDHILAQHIQSIQQRSQKLAAQAKETLWQQEPHQFINHLDELQVAMEALQIAEQELRQQNEELVIARHSAELERQRYQELFEFAPGGYLVTDVYGVVREANRVASQLLNIPQHLLIGKPLASFVAEEHRRSFRTLLNRSRDIYAVQEWEMRLCGREGHQFDAVLTVETVRNSQKQGTGLRWLMRDITTKKQAEEKLRQVQLQNLELMEVDRLKNQFLATISHELRTPLNAILGFSDLLLRQVSPERDAKIAGMIERIFRNGKYLLSLIETLLDFTKLRGQQIELKLEPFDLIELVNAIVADLRSLAEQKGLNLNLETCQECIPIVNDNIRLRQILINLLSNAIKFTEEGEISLIVEELSEEQVRLLIRDTGVGIAVPEQARVFQEFWQADQSTTRQPGGTGLGLAIVKALVNSMQGEIQLESELGAGTTFSLTLPRWVNETP